MREFASLNPEKLLGAFDAEIHGEEPIVKLEEAPGKITISYIFPGFYLVDDSRDVADKKIGFKQISIAAIGSMGKSGRPQLPSFGRYVQIPQNSNYKVAVKTGKQVVFDDVIITPSQQMQTDSPDEKAKFEYDAEFYAKDTLYPEDIVTVSGPFNLDQYNALLVHVTPFQYNPAARKLIGYGNITVTLSIKAIKRAKKGEEMRPSPAASNKAASGNLLLNPGSRIEARLSLPEKAASSNKKETAMGPEIRRGPELLIIYAKTCEEASKKLAGWKNRRGLLTTIFSIDSIGNDVNKIKGYIRSEKEKNSDLNYVILFGDVDTIAAENVPHPSGDSITDYYYSTKTDATGPESLVFPWLSMGRIPVNKESDALSIVDQIISYETEPSSDPEYYKRMVFTASFEVNKDGKDGRGYLKTMEDIRTRILPLGYRIKRVYVTDKEKIEFYHDGTPIPADVKAAVVDPAVATKMLIDAVGEGQLFIGHRDHGSAEGWVHPSFTVEDLDKVEGKTTTIFYSINCSTGQFDLNYLHPEECFAEKILRMDGAAPSLIAATRPSNTELNNDLVKGIFDATFGGVIPTFPSGSASYPITFNRLGDILNYGKSYLPTCLIDGSEYIKDHFEIYHVIGDPTIELWKDAPRAVSLKASLKSALKKKVLDILLSDCPKGCTLTIWADEVMLRRLEPSSTHVTLSIDSILTPAGTPAKALYVCFHAPGCRYREVKVKLGK